jgi:hypothetical protein
MGGVLGVVGVVGVIGGVVGEVVVPVSEGGVVVDVSTGGGVCATSTVTLHEPVPVGPVDVAVYVVVLAGVTSTEPAAVGCTAPTSLLISSVVAFVAVHERLTEPVPA